MDCPDYPGRWKTKTATCDSQEEGVKLPRKLQRDLEQGTLVTGPKKTLKEYLEYWLEDVHKSNIKIASYVKYRKVINEYIVPALGHLTLEKLTPQHVQSLYNKKQKDGLAPKTIHSIHGVLHLALKNAVRWSYVSRNVCDFVTLPRLVTKEAVFLTIDQARLFLRGVREHRLELMLMLTIVTGMRRGEVLALRWSDIHVEHQELQVLHTVDYLPNYGYVETEPKTKAGKRKITLPLFLLDILQEYKGKQEEARRHCDDWENRDLVFPDLKGGYFNPNYLLRAFKKVLRDPGLAEMSLHDLRHSAATILLAMGIHPKVVQELLGHSSFLITMNLYGHVFPSMMDEAVEKWNEQFNTEFTDAF